MQSQSPNTSAKMLRNAALSTATVLLALLILGNSEIGRAFYIDVQIDVFQRINQALSPWPLFWRNVTEFGDALVLFPFFAFLIYLKPQAWAALFAAAPLTASLSALGKHFAAMPRPAAVLGQEQFTVLGSALTAHNSLPSGHTMTVFAVITVIVGSFVSFKKGSRAGWWLLPSFGFAVLVAVSRMAVGAHWPLDVIFGAYLGTIGGMSGLLLTRRTTSWWAWLSARWARGVCGALMMAWGTILGYHSVVVRHNELAVPWLAALCAFSIGTYLLFLTLMPRIVQGRGATELSPDITSRASSTSTSTDA